MQLKQITDQLDIWKDWRDNYQKSVPKFIDEARLKSKWEDWDKHVFWEYFTRSSHQCVSSLRQGYFTKVEQQRLKDHWADFAPLLKEIAENDTVPRFDLYASLENKLLPHLDSRKIAAIHRLIAGLQPRQLTTVIKHSFLNELYQRLKDNGIDIPDYDYGNWYKGSYQILQFFKKSLPHLDYYDLVTFPWQTLDHLKYNDISINIMDEYTQGIIDVLLYKKQIILQGPPGTGKTRLAQEIAGDLTGGGKEESLVELTDKMIVDTLKGVSTVYTVATEKPYKVIKVDTAAKRVILEKTSGVLGESSFDAIRQHFQSRSWKERIDDNEVRRATAIAKFIYDGLYKEQLKENDQYKIIQFHPSYTYEDFVRGIVARPNPDGTGILYDAENKLLADFAKTALENWRAATSPVALSKETWLEEMIDNFLEYLSDLIINGSKEVKLTPMTYVSKIGASSIRFNGDNWDLDGGVPLSDLTKMYLANVKSLPEIRALASLTKTAKHQSSYWLKMLELFREFLAAGNHVPPTEVAVQPLKQYVLIIDEINRANLSSVLGELIYALEYRGEKVDSLYEVEGEDQLVIPPNLLIIGTMNTADRSVGHIDYAIRRRFAFIDVLPEILEDVEFETELFQKVSRLFVINMDPEQPSEHLSSEFRAKDVWIGHSYFIKNKDVDFSIRLRYEVIPILEEYLRDGVLKNTAQVRQIINELKTAYKTAYKTDDPAAI
jgi:5-methylcytosine-specific restriction protein B